MKFPILLDIGLSPNEGQIYEVLLELKEAGAGEIATKSGVHRRNVYDVLQRLLEKGLVYQVFGKGDITYRAVDPGKLSEFLTEKQEKLAAVMPNLEATFRSAARTEEAYIYKGVEGMKNYLRDLLRVGEDAYFIAAKGAWFDPRLTTFLQGFLKEAERRNITYHHLFDAAIRGVLPTVPQTVKPPYKFLPAKYATGSMVDIFGDHVVLFTGAGLAKIEDDMTLFVLVSRPLADSFRTWFQLIWDQTEPEPQPSSPSDDVPSKPSRRSGTESEPPKRR